VQFAVSTPEARLAALLARCACARLARACGRAVRPRGSGAPFAKPLEQRPAEFPLQGLDLVGQARLLTEQFGGAGEDPRRPR